MSSRVTKTAYEEFGLRNDEDVHKLAWINLRSFQNMIERVQESSTRVQVFSEL